MYFFFLITCLLDIVRRNSILVTHGSSVQGCSGLLEIKLTNIVRSVTRSFKIQASCCFLGKTKICQLEQSIVSSI